MKLQEKISRTHGLLQDIQGTYAPTVFANSLGAEDMVLTHMIAEVAPAIEMFMLDTGRLHDETYQLLERVRERYGIQITTYFPSTSEIENYVNVFGSNAFYRSVEMRKACCNVRKVQPLRRALQGKNAWITGLRREQSVTRADLKTSEWDGTFNLQKFSPLLEWTQDDVWTFIKQFNVPYNALHDRNFLSIGCAPCTRAVAPGEDVRAGRWWWENPDSKECGLHAVRVAQN